MTNNQRFEFIIDNIKYVFTAQSGTVISTEQRSDTYVSGSGSRGGHSHVSSSVEVTRDIWVKTADEKEQNWRYLTDIPVRESQKLYKIYLQRNGKDFGEVILFNATTEKYRQFIDSEKIVNPRLLTGFLRFLYNCAIIYSLLWIMAVSEKSSLFFFVALVTGSLIIWFLIRLVTKSNKVDNNMKSFESQFSNYIDFLKRRAEL